MYAAQCLLEWLLKCASPWTVAFSSSVYSGIGCSILGNFWPKRSYSRIGCNKSFPCRHSALMVDEGKFRRVDIPDDLVLRGIQSALMLEDVDVKIREVSVYLIFAIRIY